MNATYRDLLGNFEKIDFRNDETGTVISFKHFNDLFYWVTYLESFKSKKIKTVRANNIEQIETFFKKLVERISRLNEWKKESASKNKIERDKFLNELKIGDIFVSSWGYEQTNVDYYQITSIKGCKIGYREINCKRDESKTSGCDMSDYVLPCPNDFKDKEVFTIIHGSGIPLASYKSARKWEGTSDYRSWYY